MTTKRILVVEDDGIIGRDIERSLKKRGYQVIGVVPTGEEAILRAGDERPDLVIMDIMLKGSIDGIEAAQQLRSQYEVPVVYLTALGDPTTLQRASATAPFGYLLKPFEEHDLHAAVESALYRREMEQEQRSCRGRIAAALAATFDGIIVSDSDGIVMAISRVGSELTGWTYQDAIGRDWAEVFRTTEPLPSDLALLAAGVDPDGLIDGRSGYPVSDGKGSTTASLAVLNSKRGRRILVEHRLVPMTDAQGRVDGTVLAFRPLTVSSG